MSRPWLLLSLFAAATAAAMVACPRAQPATEQDKADASAERPTAVSSTPPRATAPPPKELESMNAFSLALYSKLRNGRGNVFVSGSSVRAAAHVAYLGARGETAREMATVFGFDTDPSKSAAVARAQREAWMAARGAAELLEANRSWIDPSMPLLPEFTALATAAYEGSVAPIDFIKDPESARQAINAWVGERTNTRIPELLPGGSITELTRAVLTNALFFKASWSQAFPKASTVQQSFSIDDKTSQPVPMMHQTAKLRFGSLGFASVLELPYAGSDLAMVVVLPEDRNGLAKIEATLSPQAIESFTSSLVQQQVAVSLPRFSFRAGGSVKSPLRELGMRRAFESSADFTAMTNPSRPTDRVVIDDVFHQTFVSVDEAGTEAAAATGVVMQAPRTPSPPKQFVADHPFLFFVRDTKRGRVLFFGRLMQPTA